MSCTQYIVALWMLLFSVRPNWAAIAGCVKILGGPILIWMDFNTRKRERAREIGTDWNIKSRTRKTIVFPLERSCRIYDIFGRHNSYLDGFQCGKERERDGNGSPLGLEKTFSSTSCGRKKSKTSKTEGRPFLQLGQDGSGSL